MSTAYASCAKRSWTGAELTHKHHRSEFDLQGAVDLEEWWNRQAVRGSVSAPVIITVVLRGPGVLSSQNVSTSQFAEHRYTSLGSNPVRTWTVCGTTDRAVDLGTW